MDHPIRKKGHYHEKPISPNNTDKTEPDDENKFLLAFYERWKEEIFYRRHRTSFITTWASTLFVAVSAAVLSEKVSLENNGKIWCWIVICAIIAVSELYFLKNSIAHKKAARALLDLEESIYLKKRNLIIFYPGRPTSKEVVRKKYFSELGSGIQAVLVILLGLLCLIVIWYRLK
jgi:hypothetical protein